MSKTSGHRSATTVCDTLVTRVLLTERLDTVVTFTGVRYQNKRSLGNEYLCVLGSSIKDSLISPFI